MSEIISILRQLHDLDRCHAKAVKERSAAPGQSERQELLAALEEARGRQGSLMERLKQGRVAFKGVEIDLRGTEERLSHDETRLYGGEVTSAKEISQLEQRVAEDRAKRAQLEDKYLALMEELDDLESRLKAAREEEARLNASLSAFDRELEQRLRDEAREDQDYDAARKALLTRLPNPIREKYERLQARNPGSALALIERGNCGGCHNALSQAEIERISRMPGLASCENCGRILAPPDGLLDRQG